MKILPYLPYIGMALKLCTCRLFTRTTCSLLLPGLELDMTFPFRPYKVCPFHSDIKTSLTVRSMGWILANLALTPPHRTSSTLKMSPSCQGILHHLNRHTMMSVQIPPTAEIDQASSSCLLSYWETRDQHLYLFAFIIFTLWAEKLRV